jgi:restriction system protein
MIDIDNVVWGIHAGAAGQGNTLFLKKNLIAVGWRQMGNLAELQADRESFKTRLAEAFPRTKKGAVPVHAGVLYRFVHEMQVGDLVVYPSKVDRQVHIGIIEGDYQYSPNLDQEYCHNRAVKWGKAAPRTTFTQGALYEIGSAVTLFLVRSYAQEFLAVYEGKSIPDLLTLEDETIAYVIADIEQNTRDYILKRISQQLKGHPFAHFIAHLLEQMGYQTRVSPEGPDRGIDIIAHKDELGFEPPIVKVQVKSTDGSTGDPDVAALYGKVSTGEFGLFITLGSFTRQAKNFAEGKSNLRLIDGDELVNLVLQHYEEFDSKYKGLLPLRQVYIPESLEESE